MSQAPAVPDVTTVPLSRIQKLVAKQMVQSWTTVPHVTHHDWADVEALESDRVRRNARGEGRVSALALYVKAVAKVLRALPRFNATLDPVEQVVSLQHGCNIGIAIAIPDGLVVGTVRDCDTKSAEAITEEIAALSEKARTKGLSYAEMSGGGFTISSLGANGGEGFTPIVNIPQVAILGLGRLHERPVRGDDAGVAWRRMLPLSLSYDHRVIGGADAAEFLTALRKALADAPEA